MTEDIAFHDLQQGGRTRDLPYYRELARRSGSTLELGAGTGRVALELAGLTDLSVNELDEHLLRELVRRAEARSLSVTPVPGDATTLDLCTTLRPHPRARQLRADRRWPRARGKRFCASSHATWRQPAWPWSPSPTWTRSCASARRPAFGHDRQLAATEVEAGAQVSWQRTVGDRVDTARLTIHRVSTEDVAADAHACGLHLSRVHHDPGDAASLGSSYCVLNHASVDATSRGSSPSARRTPRRSGRPARAAVPAA